MALSRLQSHLARAPAGVRASLMAAFSVNDMEQCRLGAQVIHYPCAPETPSYLLAPRLANRTLTQQLCLDYNDATLTILSCSSNRSHLSPRPILKRSCCTVNELIWWRIRALIASLHNQMAGTHQWTGASGQAESPLRETSRQTGQARAFQGN